MIPVCDEVTGAANNSRVSWPHSEMTEMLTLRGWGKQNKLLFSFMFIDPLVKNSYRRCLFWYHCFEEEEFINL